MGGGVMRPSEVYVRMLVTVRREIAAAYSGYGGRLKQMLRPGIVCRVESVNVPKVRIVRYGPEHDGRDVFARVSFVGDVPQYEHSLDDGRWEAGVNYCNLKGNRTVMTTYYDLMEATDKKAFLVWLIHSFRALICAASRRRPCSSSLVGAPKVSWLQRSSATLSASRNSSWAGCCIPMRRRQQLPSPGQRSMLHAICFQPRRLK
jgi:hypothetical protein